MKAIFIKLLNLYIKKKKTCLFFLFNTHLWWVGVSNSCAFWFYHLNMQFCFFPLHL